MPSLALLVLKTHQMEAVRRFYAALGIEFQQEKHEKGPIHFSGQLGDTILEIFPLPPDRTSDVTTRLGFVVDDLSKVLETLVANGLIGRKVPEETESGLLVVLRDPDGRAVELTQQKT
jgi:predicted enzyme related to lactoylglutathione lyase